jgi:hypothetical protein
MKTVVTAQTVMDLIGNNPGGVRVRMEDSTDKVFAYSAVKPWKVGYTHDDVITRRGFVDIVVYKQQSAWRPVLIIENKGYIRGFSGIRADTLRISQFLNAVNSKGQKSIEAGVETFFYRESGGVTKRTQTIKSGKFVKTVVNSVRDQLPDFTVRSATRLLYSSGFPNRTTALALNDDGQPAYEAECPISVYGVAIAISKDPANLLSSFQLNSSPVWTSKYRKRLRFS